MAERDRTSRNIKSETASADASALERMDAALKGAMKMPPRKHKDERKRAHKSVKKPK